MPSSYHVQARTEGAPLVCRPDQGTHDDFTAEPAARAA